jgi:hypothetical protein
VQFSRQSLSAQAPGRASAQSPWRADLVGFTVTFDVAIGFAFVGGRAAFLGAAAL